MKKIIPIILSGGDGKRLWPLSHKMLPKPFIEISGKTLLEQSVRRAKLVSKEAIIVTNEKYFEDTKKIISNISKPPKIHYLLEPSGYDTAPAVALATAYLKFNFNEDTLCLLLPADHLISKQENFKRDINLARKVIDEKSTVIFGIKPNYPETGFGYIQAKKKKNKELKLNVKQFLEKPKLSKAKIFIKSSDYFWNAGMAIFSIKSMIRKFEIHAPKIWDVSVKAFERKLENNHENSLFFPSSSFKKFKKQSFDYAILEKDKDIFLIPASFGWSDVGSWKSLSDNSKKDRQGNSFSSNKSKKVFTQSTKDTHLEIIENSKKVYALFGVNDLVIADSPDALLISDKDKSNEIKNFANKIISANSFSELNKEVFRPWGSFTTILNGPGFQVKIIKIKSNQKISLQYHKHREEHWVFLSGKGLVQIDDNQKKVKKGDYAYIKRQQIHRLSNVGKDVLSLIEVQLGSITSEDDIVRIEDEYGRK